ncbi:hypothetical protein [Acidisoma sp. 7E03]
MARLSKEDQTRILVLVTEEHRPVRAVAAEMGCTPAAIYALLGRLRRERGAEEPAVAQPPLALETEPAHLPAVVLQHPAEDIVSVPALALPAAPPAPVPVPQTPAPRSAERPMGARLSKPGMGLITRSADGDESVMPFRSLDDLLSAIKPILREGARSPEPVWFSLQTIDLAALDVDAA